MQNEELLWDCSKIRFEWMGENGQAFEIDDPVAVKKTAALSIYRNLAGNEIIVKHTWDVCIVVKRKPEK